MGISDRGCRTCNGTGWIPAGGGRSVRCPGDTSVPSLGGPQEGVVSSLAQVSAPSSNIINRAYDRYSTHTTPPQSIKAGEAKQGTAYTRAIIIHRDVLNGTGEHREEVIERAGVWESDTDPATDAIGRDLYPRPSVEGFLPVRAVLIAENPDGSITEYTVPYDEAAREKIARRAFKRKVERAERDAEIRAHSFPANELRKSMKVRLSDGRAVIIEHISISSYSTNWSIKGKDDEGNDVSGIIDSKKPVYVYNHTRRR